MKLSNRNAFIAPSCYIWFVLIISCKPSYTNEYWDNKTVKKVVTEERFRGDSKLTVVKHYTKDCTDTSKYFYVEKYYTAGQIESRGQIKNGQKDSLWEAWYEDGTKALEENYNKGRHLGKYQSWLPDGKILETVMYK